jgi:phosphoglucomutase/phosphomannomutase
LADYVLRQLQQVGTLTGKHYLVKTLVTTEMVRRIGDSYGVKTYGDLLVGFKWIAGVMDQVGPEYFVLGTEESHGYLVGQYARDKDGAVAAMLLAELAAHVKSAGQTLHDKLDSLFWQHGYHAERLLNLKMEGSEGMERMQALMSRFRTNPPDSLAGLPVACARDYLHGRATSPGGQSEPFEGPQGDLVMLDLAETGNYVAVRPSGTEPKVKFYMFTYVAPEMLADLEMSKQEMAQRLTSLEEDLKDFAEKV